MSYPASPAVLRLIQYSSVFRWMPALLAACHRTRGGGHDHHLGLPMCRGDRIHFSVGRLKSAEPAARREHRRKGHRHAQTAKAERRGGGPGRLSDCAVRATGKTHRTWCMLKRGAALSASTQLSLNEGCCAAQQELTPMSARGRERRCWSRLAMSAIPSIATIEADMPHFAFGPKADSCAAT